MKHKKGYFGTWGKGKQKGVMQGALYYMRKKKRRISSPFPPNKEMIVQHLDGTYTTSEAGIYELVDIKLLSATSTTRPPQNGKGYLGDGTAYITITGLLTTDTIVVPSYSDTPTCTVDGRLDIASGDKISHVSIQRAGTELWFYPCEEDTLTVMYDIINDNHGTKVNIVDENFHIEDINFDSRLNEVGYGTSSSLTGVFVPLKDDGTAVVACDAVYTGLVKKNCKMNNSNIITLDGTDDYIDLDAHISVVASLTTGTIKGMFKCENTGALQKVFSASNTGSASSDISTYVYHTGGIFKIDIRNAGVVLLRWETSNAYDDDEWHTYEFEVTATGNSIIIDGVAGVGAYATGNSSTSKFFADVVGLDALRVGIGEDNGGVEYPFKGSMSYAKVLDGNGSELIDLGMAEEIGTAMYDRSGNGNHGTATNITESTFRTVESEGIVRPINLIDGFDLWLRDSDSKELKIVFDNDGNSIKTDGDTITGYTWDSIHPQLGTDGKLFHNDAETEFRDYESPAMNNSDKLLPTKYLFDASGIAQDISYDEMTYDEQSAHVIVMNAKANEKKDRIVYDSVQTGDNLDDVYDFIDDLTSRDSNNNANLDENDEDILTEE